MDILRGESAAGQCATPAVYDLKAESRRSRRITHGHPSLELRVIGGMLARLSPGDERAAAPTDFYDERMEAIAAAILAVPPIDDAGEFNAAIAEELEKRGTLDESQFMELAASSAKKFRPQTFADDARELKALAELRRLVLAAEDIADAAKISGTVEAAHDRIREIVARLDLSPVSVHPDDAAPLPDWGAGRPKGMAADAFHGPVGELVTKLAPHTEAASAAVLVSILAGLGNAMGRGPHVMTGAARHGLNEFVLVVGDTGSGRKGTSWGVAKTVLSHVDAGWAGRCIRSGLSSGEGLKHAIRDPVHKFSVKAQAEEMVDPGIDDKRLLCVEPEFSAILAHFRREGNVLRDTLRQAWDGENLGAMTRQDSLTVTNPHVSLIAHITPDELRARLEETDVANGLINRFVVIHSHSDKCLPLAGALPESTLEEYGRILGAAVHHAKSVGEVRLSAEAEAIWAGGMYQALHRSTPGRLGDVLQRGAPHVLRMAAIFALADCRDRIGPEHLRAASAVWEYATRSAACVFGDATGNRVADTILERLREIAPDGMTRSEVGRKIFGDHKAKDVGAALAMLVQAGKIREETIPTGGKPARKYYATAEGETYHANPAFHAGGTENQNGDAPKRLKVVV
jgi:hypothetical protein